MCTYPTLMSEECVYAAEIIITDMEFVEFVYATEIIITNIIHAHNDVAA